MRIVGKEQQKEQAQKRPMKHKTSLTLPEELTLLMLRDDAGTVPAGTHTTYALGGAILAELLLHERVTVEKTRFSNKLVLVDASPVGDPFIDEALKKLVNAKRDAAASTWVGRFGERKHLFHDIAQSLADRGILLAETTKVLRLFTKKVYPELDPKPEEQLRERLREAIFETGVGVSERTVIALAIANAIDVLRHNFDRVELKTRKKHIKQLIEGDQASKAVTSAIEAMQAAMIAIMVVTTTT